MKPQTSGFKPNVDTRATAKGKQRTSHGRTSRACDRCRIKKAKCDGAQTCKTCRASDIACVYSARRREARNYYCQMREATDRALQRLYWACRNGTGFPGQISEESKDVITTMDILKDLGLVDPDFDEFELSNSIKRSTYESKGANEEDRSIQAIRPRHQEELDNDQPSLSLCSTSSRPSPSTERVRSPINQHSSSGPPKLWEEDHMKEQFAAFSPRCRLVPQDRRIKEPGEPNPASPGAEDVAEPHDEDVDAFLDISLCTPPTPDSQSSLLSHDVGPSKIQSMTALQVTPGPTFQSPSAIIFDGFLSPWPGSLAAAYQAVAT